MPEANPYKILQVARNADPDTIEDAYDRLFDRYEPLAESGDDEAIRMLEQLNRAHETLADPQQRAELDARLAGETRQVAQSAQRRTAAPAGAAVTTQARPRAATRTTTSTRQTAGGQRSRRTVVAEPPRRQIPPVFLVSGGVLLLLVVLVAVFLISRNTNGNSGNPSAGSGQNSGFSPSDAKATAAAQATLTDTGAIDVNSIPTPGALGGMSTKDPNFIAATVNGQPVYMYELTRRYVKDVIVASNDPLMGSLLAEENITSTRMLDVLAQDSLDKLINMQVILGEARAEAIYPNADQINMVVEQAKAHDLQGMSFDDFLKTNNITAQQYQDNVVRNVVYAIMASKHVPQTGSDDDKQTGFINWICTARKKYEVKINLTFTAPNQPCTSGLPSDVPLTTDIPTPPPNQQQAPPPQDTAAPPATNP